MYDDNGNTDRSISERASSGVMALDMSLGEDWVKSIDLDKFVSIQNPSGCLLDQLYGDYADGENALIDLFGPVYYNDYLVDSFSAASHNGDAEKLTEEYRSLIYERIMAILSVDNLV